MEDEKRHVLRVNKSLVVRYALAVSPRPEKWDVTHIINIGEKGVRITVSKDFATGDILDLIMQIPFRPFEPLHAQGEIVSAEELTTAHGEHVAGCKIVSVEFIDISVEQQSVIKEYVAWFKERYGGEA